MAGLGAGAQGYFLDRVMEGIVGTENEQVKEDFQSLLLPPDGSNGSWEKWSSRHSRIQQVADVFAETSYTLREYNRYCPACSLLAAYAALCVRVPVLFVFDEVNALYEKLEKKTALAMPAPFDLVHLGTGYNMVK
jgi:hypothetical protein